MIVMEASRNGIVALIALDTESPPAHGYAAFDERPYRSEDSARNKIAHVVSDRNHGGEPTNTRRRFRDHAVTCRASAAAGRTPMSDFIRLVLSNFTVTFLVIGLIASAIALARAPKPLTAPVIVEALFAYFVLFSIGCSFFYNFIMHTFFGAMTARFIGWADSPFQTELGLASLGFAVVGFLAFRGGFDLRLAAVTGPALFHARRSRSPYSRHDHHREFRPGQRRHGFLHGYSGPDRRPRTAVVPARISASD
jgi:hypothetical protein